MKKTSLFLCLFFCFSIAFCQCISGDCNNGFGQIELAKGTYFGYFKNGQLDGAGIVRASNGDTYQGEFSKGQFHGIQYYKRRDKTTVLGEYVNSVQNGVGLTLDDKNNFGAYTWKDGKIISEQSVQASSSNPANCLGDCINGVGVLTHSDSSYTLALFKNKQAYLGTIANSETTYNGQIYNNIPHGFGVQTDGFSTYIGHFKNGKKDGKGVHIGLLGAISVINIDDEHGNFNQSEFSKELKTLLNKPLYQLKESSFSELAFFRYKVNDYFLGSLNIYLNAGLTTSDFISISLEKNDKKLYTMEEVYKALDNCDFLTKKDNKTYGYKDLTIKLKDEKHNYAIEIFLPENIDVDSDLSCIQGNCKDGFGKKQFEEGIYEGNFKNSKFNGKGEFKNTKGASYNGAWVNNIKTGIGKLIRSNGTSYIGSFKNDKRHGNGKEYDSKETLLLTGNWTEDLLKNGTQYFISGKYIGSFKNDKFHGQGKVYDKPGTLVFQGEFKNGHKIYGTSFLKNGNKHTGNWKNDKIHGQGTLTLTDKSKYEGYFVNEKKEGSGKTFDSMGKLNFEGTWKNDYKEFGSEYNKDGTYSGPFKNNLPHGQGTFVASNNSKYIGAFTNGKRAGKGKFYTPEGKLHFDGTWKNNSPQYGTQYFVDGKFVGPLVNSKPHGIGKFYDKNGNLVFSGEFNNGRPKK